MAAAVRQRFEVRGREAAGEHDIRSKPAQRSPGAEIDVNGIHGVPAAEAQPRERMSVETHRSRRPVPTGMAFGESQHEEIAALCEFREQRDAVRRDDVSYDCEAHRARDIP